MIRDFALLDKLPAIVLLTQPDDKLDILVCGICVSAAGVVLAFIMNIMNKREHDRFVGYVYRKALEMQADPNSRQRFNMQVSEGHVHTDAVGPNGVR